MILKPDERAALELRGIYEEYGYRKYRMGRFEEYSLYAENKDFLSGDRVLTFTDLDGRLMALKPDVTLSIIKNTKATREHGEKLYYIENIYRESKESHTFKEISQLGLEMLGNVDTYGITEVVSLAQKSLASISPASSAGRLPCISEKMAYLITAPGYSGLRFLLMLYYLLFLLYHHYITITQIPKGDMYGNQRNIIWHAAGRERGVIIYPDERQRPPRGSHQLRLRHRFIMGAG